MSKVTSPKFAVTDLDAGSRKPAKPVWITDEARRKHNWLAKRRSRGSYAHLLKPFEVTIEYKMSKQHAKYKEALKRIVEMTTDHYMLTIAKDALEYEPECGVAEDGIPTFGVTTND